ADRALKELKIAEQINSNDVYIHVGKAEAYRIKGQFDPAIQELLSVSEWDNQSTQLPLNLAWVYEDDGQYGKAIENYKAFDLLVLNEPDAAKTNKITERYQMLKSELDRLGPEAVWHAEMERLRKESDYYGMAKLASRLGNTNEVFQFLDSAHSNHDGMMEFLL